jgi:hypothetical protein
VRILLQLLGEQICHEAVVADRAIVSGNAGASQERRPLRPRAIAKAEQNGHLARQCVLEDCERRNPHAASNQEGSPAVPRRREALPERA